MLLADVVDTSARVAETRSRKQKVAHLSARLAALRGAEIPIGSAFLAGELVDGRIGLGYAAVRKAQPAGEASEPTLTLSDVAECFAAIAACAGAGSVGRRQQMFEELLGRATADEQRFLRRLVVGELRQGASVGVLAEAVAAASDVPADEVRRAAMLGGALEDVVATALVEGRDGLARFRLQVGRPVQPMLASPGEDTEAVLAKLGEAAFEWKLDGARIQVHRDGDDLRVFTRRLHDVTAAVPEVVEAVAALDESRLVLDGEVLALDADGRPRPFQDTMRRFGRKLDVAALAAELPLTPFFFDVLHAGGDDVLERPGHARWDVLAAVLPAAHLVPRLVTDDVEAAEAFFGDALARGHEGLVAKAVDAAYEAGRRGAQWLKLKPAHTLDLVVLAAEWGSGRRRGRLSNLHLGARDETGVGFVMLGKTFKGMTDEILAWQTDALQRIATGSDGAVVSVRPELVVEIAFDGVQRSPQYPGGVALRFARLKGYRPDKDAAQADTLAAVRALLG